MWPGSLVNKERDANYAQTADCTYFYQRSSVAYYLTTTRVNLRLCFAPEPQAEKREERRNTEWRDRWVFCPVHHPTRFPDPSYLAIVYHRGGCRALGRLHKISLPFCVTIYPVASALVAPEPARIFPSSSFFCGSSTGTKNEAKLMEKRLASQDRSICLHDIIAKNNVK